MSNTFSKGDETFSRGGFAPLRPLVTGLQTTYINVQTYEFYVFQMYLFAFFTFLENGRKS